MANKVTPGAAHINTGLKHLFSFNWLYGFCLSIAMYWTLNVISPDRRTLIPEVVHGTPSALEGVDVDSEKHSSFDDVKHSMEVSGAKEVGLVAAA